MADPGADPTLQDVADAAGYARSTVSLALRNHPSLPRKTREAIQFAARRIGYRPNPLVAALMTQLRGKRHKHQERIALISRSDQLPSRMPGYFKVLYQAVVAEAARQGIGIDEFFRDPAEPMPDRRLSQILLARGIHGVLFFPGGGSEGVEYPSLDWEHFATVLIGFNTAREGLHQVSSDYSYDIDRALQEVRAAGYRRVGFVVPAEMDQSTNHIWSSRFLLYQHGIPARDRIPLVLTPGYEFDRKALLRWLKEERPEAIVAGLSTLYEFFEAAGVDIPRDVAFVDLTKRTRGAAIAGVDPQTAEVGRAAVELLVSLLQANQRGLAEFSRSIAVKGKWSAGASLPRRIIPPVPAGRRVQRIQ